MPIFISHTTQDDALARRVYSRLKINHNIDCYIDDMDKELASKRGTSQLTQLLVDRLRRCDTVLAVVSSNTKNSWWVPFEIGTAREMPRIITSFTSLPDRLSYTAQECLPEYLLEWPRFRSDSDIDLFARQYKQKSLILESGRVKIAGAHAGLQDVRNFEANVMKSLGQRNF
ncbi:toll/interleukin-1 receptor domain-containing protein [Geobacter sp. SVR]|uniref:toll/interleukin-1 receptor domain-containing protein n=1 Tax=Geobacter sp. SVR TaxID=2495594 RepID=UPI00143EF93B|nr:toll/interleukin-1 receptor domain-containing protein [Geobacter sp. SVR]BCS54327.1 hypothetical protein GSVR_26350 [Geobacter sp. SVR]GCF85814.1 hypothetical protein GSbR_24140 [Geobacter sp. SVR]